MHGKHIFSLTVYSTVPGFRNPSRSMVFKVTGPKSIDGADWKYAQMPIKRPNIVVDRLVNFIFDGVRGQSFYSDIAIDDVMFEPRKCTAILAADLKELQTTPVYTQTTTTTLASTTTEALPQKPLQYLPKAYSNYIPATVHPKYCNPGNEMYLPDQQICCQGHVMTNLRGDKCCGQAPIYSKKQLCCQIDNEPTILLRKDFICCNGQKYSAKIFGCCKNQVYRLDESSMSCCKYDNKQQEKYDPAHFGCCEKANRIFNKTESYCCGTNVEFKFNKSNKCCGEKNSSGKMYMNLANECCVGPDMDESHYLWEHYNDRKFDLSGTNKYQLYRKFSQGCCEGILYNLVEEQCVDKIVSKQDKKSGGVSKGPPAWLTAFG